MFFVDNGKTCIYFDKGNFDNYCVYVNCPGHFKYAPKDYDYFKWILGLSKRYGVTQVWNDFWNIYERTADTIDYDIKQIVYNIDMHYNEDTVLWWLIFYMTMVAECKKEKAILKKRIKALGVYNILIDEYTIEHTITYMKGKHWKFLDELMKERGI